MGLSRISPFKGHVDSENHGVKARLQRLCACAVCVLAAKRRFLAGHCDNDLQEDTQVALSAYEPMARVMGSSEKEEDFELCRKAVSEIVPPNAG